MQPRYDVFLSHNSADKSLVREIAQSLESRKIRVWFDEWELQPGVQWQPALEQALTECGATVVFIGPHGLGKWESPEMQVALNTQLHKNHPVIPVLLPGVSDEIKQTIPAFLRLNTWVDFSKGVNDQNAINRLLWGITGINPYRPSQPAMAPSQLSQSEQGRVDEAVANLVRFTRTGNITFFIGWGSPYENRNDLTRAFDVARELLIELHIIEPSYDKILPPIDLAGLYYAIGKSGERDLENKVVDLLIDRAALEPRVYQNLAKLLQTLALRPMRRVRRRVPQLIVTTNPDTMMERALLRAGLPFTRIVQHRSARQITTNEYRNVALVDQNRRIRVTFDTSARSDHRDIHTQEVRVNDDESIDELIATAGLRTISYGSNDPDACDQNSLESLSLESLTEPFLYKFIGSQDVPDSCVITINQYFDFIQRVVKRNCIPSQITEIIANSAALFFGAGYLDPDFRLMYHLLLRKQLEVATDSDMRFALQLPPDPANTGNYRHIEAKIWSNLKEAALKQLGIITLEERGDVFFQRIIDGVKDQL